jgi:predicted RNase H-like nuclease (RuvC/YqgF family)
VQSNGQLRMQQTDQAIQQLEQQIQEMQVRITEITDALSNFTQQVSELQMTQRHIQDNFTLRLIKRDIETKSSEIDELKKRTTNFNINEFRTKNNEYSKEQSRLTGEVRLFW